MKRKRHRADLSIVLAELAIASMETIAWRGWMIASGTCTPAEYRRMVREKAAAVRESARALSRNSGSLAVLEPWHGRATRNAKRLRRRFHG